MIKKYLKGWYYTFCFAEAAANVLTNPQLDHGKIPEFKFSAAYVEKASPALIKYKLYKIFIISEIGTFNLNETKNIRTIIKNKIFGNKMIKSNF